MNFEGKKVLIAYFSHVGETFSNGDTVELEKGNTETVVKHLAKKFNADTFKIETKQIYPVDYKACSEIAKQELESNIRPELVKNCSIEGYDVIILGFPCWWRTVPMAVLTFIESHDFTGKTILPFSTHEWSGKANSETDIRKAAPTANLLEGFTIHGTWINTSEDKALAFVDKWFDEN